MDSNEPPLPSAHEKLQSTNSYDARTTGGYELNPSNSNILAERLREPRDFHEVIRNFDAGNTEVRDVARYTKNDRAGVIRLGHILAQQPTLRMHLPQEATAVIQRANENFQSILANDNPIAQPYVGWNFTVNAQGFKQANLPWAHLIDNSVRTTLESYQQPSRGGIDELLHITTNDADQIARATWRTVSNEHPIEMAIYLAERSQFSENYQRERYREDIAEAKRGVYSLTRELSAQYGLPIEYEKRALDQLYRVDFSAFDHMIRGVDAGDGVLADYQSGTLRIETKFGGNVAQPTESRDAVGATSHELFHATSAQVTSRDNSDLGLRCGDQGRDINEAMTELLSKLSLGRVKRHSNGSYILVDSRHGVEVPAVTYVNPVISMLSTMKGQPEMFGSLFRAYHGYTPDKQRLVSAINHFNATLSQLDNRSH